MANILEQFELFGLSADVTDRTVEQPCRRL